MTKTKFAISSALLAVCMLAVFSTAQAQFGWSTIGRPVTEKTTNSGCFTRRLVPLVVDGRTIIDRNFNVILVSADTLDAADIKWSVTSDHLEQVVVGNSRVEFASHRVAADKSAFVRIGRPGQTLPIVTTISSDPVVLADTILFQGEYESWQNYDNAVSVAICDRNGNNCVDVETHHYGLTGTESEVHETGRPFNTFVCVVGDNAETTYLLGKGFRLNALDPSGIAGVTTGRELKKLAISLPVGLRGNDPVVVRIKVWSNGFFEAKLGGLIHW